MDEEHKPMTFDAFYKIMGSKDDLLFADRVPLKSGTILWLIQPMMISLADGSSTLVVNERSFKKAFGGDFV